jgi:hypothetical protein|uniref:Uncharacterized protein n=1 Tax=virus sp. ctmTa7 TaxID=2828255 RepID=A0A8S5RCL5_9VIRU|nr:MAG TPA: hypothetical protein [virus sp. ctmTa7]
MNLKSKNEQSNKKTKVTSLDIIVTMYGDKPYYEIKYKKLGDDSYYIGYSSFSLNLVLDWKREHFELVECRDSDNYETIIERLERFVDALDEGIDSIYEHPMTNKEIIDYLVSTGLYENTEGDMFYEKKMLDENKTVPIRDLVERFVDVDKEFNGEPWNIMQILKNIDMVIPVEDRKC